MFLGIKVFGGKAVLPRLGLPLTLPKTSRDKIADACAADIKRMYSTFPMRWISQRLG